MQAVRSLLFAALFYPGTLGFVIAGLLASLVGPRPTRAVVLGWSLFHHFIARHVLRIETQVEGQVPPGPHLIAVKHEAMFETLEMVRLADSPVMVIKRELAQIPLFGWMTLRYGVIPVDRQAGARALRELVAHGRKAAATGRQIVIYPEGTRVPPGQAPALQPGFAGLYRAIGLPVVPVAVDSGRLWGRGLVKRSGTIRFRIGSPIPAGLPRDEVERQVHAAINALNLAP